ncbi:hypothetical protein BJ965_003422 [Streptomyces luteogriseus]|uniref:Uncharacterized protein n=1 Tax=Streptomyces luteogriseus TaxID=68233 RepID=A0A7W7GJZ1_9ACTN|nr:hypothetical protein [Streptomyces luteogriseus]
MTDRPRPPVGTGRSGSPKPPALAALPQRRALTYG